MRSCARAAAAVALALLVGACAGDRRPPPGIKIGKPYQVGGRTYVPRDDRDYDRTGLASWYGREHAGKPTANGERFDPGKLTAAHPTLPLPCWVSVTRLDTGASVVVRVNDRGPFHPDRIIDLSRAAARRLGMERDGIARVRVRRVAPP